MMGNIYLCSIVDCHGAAYPSAGSFPTSFEGTTVGAVAAMPVRLAVEDEVVLDAELVAGGVVRLPTTVVLDAATVVPEVVDWRH